VMKKIFWEFISKIPFKLLALACCSFWLSLMAIKWFCGLKHICSTQLFEICSSLITVRNYSSVKITFSQICQVPSHGTPRWIAWPSDILIGFAHGRVRSGCQEIRGELWNVTAPSLRAVARLHAHSDMLARAHTCFDVTHRSRHSDLEFCCSHILWSE
jgi:hypothetical protein